MYAKLRSSTFEWKEALETAIQGQDLSIRARELQCNEIAQAGIKAITDR